MTTSFKVIEGIYGIYASTVLEILTLPTSTGVGGEEVVSSYISAPPTKPSRGENSSQDSTSRDRLRFVLVSNLRLAHCRFQDWGLGGAHTMAWPRCYTCSKLYTTFEALACGQHI